MTFEQKLEAAVGAVGVFLHDHGYTVALVVLGVVVVGWLISVLADYSFSRKMDRERLEDEKWLETHLK